MKKNLLILSFAIIFFMFTVPGHCAITDGWYKIIVKHSGKAMTVKDGSTADAANIVQKTYTGANEQLWYIEKTKDTNPDTYMLINKKSQKVGDIKLASTLNGASLVQYYTKGGAGTNSDNQRFKLTDLGNGYFNIIAKHSGKALHVDMGSTSDNSQVLQWTNNNYDWYKWQIVAVTTSAAPPTTGSQACSTKYPVLLLHGIAMNDKLLSYNYFGRVPDNLTARGAKVFGGKQDAFGSYTTNAEQIKTKINDIVAQINPATKQPYGKVNIIGHSKGGLDTREMLYLYPDMKSKIASFTTIASPHRGSALGDWVFNTVSHDLLSWAIKIIGFVMGDTKSATASAEYLKRDLMVTKNAQWNSLNGYTGILCQSYAAQIITTDTLQQLDTAFLITGWIMGNIAPGTKEPNNDGAVAVDSAKFATFKGTNYMVTPGYGGITHDGITDRGLLIFPGMTPGFDAPNFYRTIVANLKTAGY
ncbi:MAG: RICIN domain-containing protein [Desulfobacterales bacterium]|nr:RICIN domain-containing protein [Desulfobacterales bacterium]MBF0395365.1 RICIN domain-containing protein [Desulfobacterales bacterium]